MKKLIIVCSLLLTLILAGVLYGKHSQREETEPVLIDQEYLRHFPEPLPGDIVLNSVFPL
jgi:hypothetical protein